MAGGGSLRRMCGRYATTRTALDLSTLFDAVDETGDGLVPDYNVAPTDPVPIVRISQRAGGRVLSTARWGLVPPWSTDTRGAARMINARAETAATARAYAPSFARRRCLVPADGWYEWLRRPDGGRQPYFMTPRTGEVLAFAGLWSVWSGGAEPTDGVRTFSILTTAALGDLALVHDRMPLLLPPEHRAAWLTADADSAAALLTPRPADLALIELRPVSRLVGDVRNDGPELIAPVPAPSLYGAATDSIDLDNATLF
jgi:putative SOS response-associated peptidase YedK